MVATVEGIEAPHNLQVSPDGGSVWAVSGHDSMAVMVDARRLVLHGAVATGKEPAHVVVTPDGRTVYTTDGGDGTVTAIDVGSMKAIGSVRVGSFPHGMRPSPDGRWLVVANAKGTTLRIVDTRTNTRAADVEVGRAPVQVAFSPDGRKVYSSVSGEDAVAKVDLATRKLVAKVRVGDGPIQVYVSPDGRTLLAANQGTAERPGRTVSLVRTADFRVQGEVETGEGAHGAVVDPSGRHAYVTNIYGNDVAVVDLRERRVARIPVGSKPNWISFSPYALAGPARTVELDLAHDEEMEEQMGGHEGG